MWIHNNGEWLDLNQAIHIRYTEGSDVVSVLPSLFILLNNDELFFEGEEATEWYRIINESLLLGQT
jgi:hypothetical protein